MPQTYMDEMARLLARMDEAYERSAAGSGFMCSGCADNCCRALFYHYTLAEYLYLRSGLAGLPAAQQDQVRSRAVEVCRQQTRDSALRPLCPLNSEGRCVLYAQRPMICRLHGVPHRLRRPDGRLLAGPGCAEFHARRGAGAEQPLDRTPLYGALAQLEQRLRAETGFKEKIKMTVAQMVLYDETGR